MKKEKQALYYALGVSLLCILYVMVTPVYSGDVDNYAMAQVTNRLYAREGQETYINYLNPILCKIFTVVGTILPKADCFTLTAHITLLAALAVGAYVIACIGKNCYEIIGCYLVLLAMIILRSLFNYNFTGWAAFLSAAGVWILLLLLHGRLRKRRWLLAAVVFMSLGLMWRYEAALVFIPYILLDAAVQVLFGPKNKTERKAGLKRVVQIIGIAAVCLSVVGFCHYATLHSEKYEEAKAYDDARCMVVDYPLQKWENVRGRLPDVTENDYSSIKRWILMDTERMNTEFLKKIGDTAQLEQNQKSLIQMQKQVIGIFLSTENMLFLGILAGALFVAVMVSKVAWYYKLQTLFIYLGTDLICLFFVFAGRAIERVFLLISYAMLVSVGVLFLTELQECNGKLFLWIKRGIVIISAAALFIGLKNTNYVQNQSVFTANESKEQAEYGDELYIWEIGSYVSVPMQRYVELGQLIPLEFTQHNIYDGAWMYGQLYFEQLLQGIDAENPMRALLEREHTYYVGVENAYVLTYLQEHFDENTTVSYAGELEGVPVWKFEIKR